MPAPSPCHWQDALRGYARHRIGQLFIVTDDDGRLCAILVSTVRDEERKRIRIWRAGTEVRVGDYLMSVRCPQYAFRVTDVAQPAEPRVSLEVARVSLPVPGQATIHRFRWDPTGKNSGRLVA